MATTTSFCGTVWVEAGPGAGTCAVCLGDNDGASTVQIPCCGNHICTSCWGGLMDNDIDTCPTCRAPIDAETGASPVQAAAAPAVYGVDSDSDSDPGGVISGPDSDSDSDSGSSSISDSDMSDDDSDDGDASPLYDPEGTEPDTIWGL
jgi:hypothetical protein